MSQNTNTYVRGGDGSTLTSDEGENDQWGDVFSPLALDGGDLPGSDEGEDDQRSDALSPLDFDGDGLPGSGEEEDDTERIEHPSCGIDIPDGGAITGSPLSGSDHTVCTGSVPGGDAGQIRLYTTDGMIEVDKRVIDALNALIDTPPDAGVFEELVTLGILLQIDGAQFNVSVVGEVFHAPDHIIVKSSDPITAPGELMLPVRRLVVELVDYYSGMQIVDADGKQSSQAVSEFVKRLCALRRRLEFIYWLITYAARALKISESWTGISYGDQDYAANVCDCGWYFRSQAMYRRMQVEDSADALATARRYASEAEDIRAQLACGMPGGVALQAFGKLVHALCAAECCADKARVVRVPESRG
jgi:hypothetical protein